MPATAAKIVEPRKPQRANGRARYEALVASTEKLLQDEGIDSLSIKRIADAAGVPMASVYHFFPSPGAACIAVAESYLEGFAEGVAQPIEQAGEMKWEQVIALLMERTVEFYRSHPYAQRLILGSDYSWQIRQADLGNNRAMAETIAGIIAPQFPTLEGAELRQALINAISIGDAILALSVAEHDVITKQFADEAILAVCSYLSAKQAVKS